MPDIALQTVLKKKKEMERKILEVITEFEKFSGATVSYVDLIHTDVVGRGSYIHDVETRVYL